MHSVIFLQEYTAFTEDLRLKCEVYEQFRVKAESKTLLVITEDKWTHLKQRWTYVSTRTHVWQWKLDSSLPGELGKIGDWLYRAEELLDADVQQGETPEEKAFYIRSQITDLKVWKQ